MWHEQLYNILNTINMVILNIIGLPFLIQIIYMLFGWLKKKTFKRSEKKSRACFLICAHNEEDVIFNTVDRLFKKLNYPRELFDVYVVAHNCSDNTAELAKKAGATVFVYNDPDPKTHFLSYSVRYGFNAISKLDKKYDFLIKIDADNYVNDDFLLYMNDAYNSGVKFARAYESALNITQNVYTKASGLYYAYDSRFASRVRECFHLAAHVNGAGCMFAMELVEKYGYDAKGLSDDMEYLCNRMIHDKIYGHFVEDAVVYEDLPSTLKDTYARNKRIGYGVSRLFFTHGFRLVGKFFVTFNFSYLEVFLQLLFCMICAVLCTWIPLYYIYDIVYLILAANGVIETTLQTSAEYMQILNTTWIVIVAAVSILFAFAGLLQAFFLVQSDYKKLGCRRRRDLTSGILMYPLFVIVYVATLCIGIFSKPNWRQVKRNKVSSTFDTSGK